MEVRISDCRLHYEEAGSGEPLVLLHGNGEDCGYFARQVEYFSAKYRVIALEMCIRDRSLTERYVNPETGAGKPVLLHGVYSWHSGKGVDEGNIWGDYFYMEALVRFWKDWNPYW